MSRKPSKHPTELELEILKVLWANGPLAVREIRRAMAANGRDLAHTTLITTLNIMTRKGYVGRETEGRGYVFSSKLSRDEVSQGVVGDLVEKVFEGSASAFLLSLLGKEQLDSADHADLRDAIERRRKMPQEARAVGEHWLAVGEPVRKGSTGRSKSLKSLGNRDVSSPFGARAPGSPQQT